MTRTAHVARPPRIALADTLRVELAEIAAFMQDRWRAAGFAYAGPAGFVLEHGKTWTAAPTLPEGVRDGAPRMCFGNAIACCGIYGMRYVEGYAMNRIDPVPVHHAWNLDDAGDIYDVTWARLAREHDLGHVAYLGVEFSVERADDATWNGNATVLDDDERGWPLLRQRWDGEPEGLEWPPSERLEALRAYVAGDRALVDELLKQDPRS